MSRRDTPAISLLVPDGRASILAGFSARRAVDALLAIEFAAISAFYLFVAFYFDRGGDARIYHRAVVAWLGGGDPWSAAYRDVVFAAPPPTLLFLAPFAWLPEDLFVALMIGGSILAAVVTLRRLALPAWWLLFPPLVEAVTTGNPNVIVVALLVVGSPAADGIAGLAKVYALVPAALLGRWRGIGLFALVLVATAPLLPWALFIERWPYITSLLRDQTGGGKSALAFWPLVPAVLGALLLLSREHRAWLSVPALWPGSQFQAGIIALPVLRHPILAASFAVPLPLVAPIGICMLALWLRFVRPRWLGTGAKNNDHVRKDPSL